MIRRYKQRGGNKMKKIRNITFFIFLSGIVFLSSFVFSQDSSPSLDFYVTNGIVYSIVASQDTVYIGGSFTYVGPNTGSGVPIDTTTGNRVSPFPKVNGGVYAVVPDGSGGWFIGGGFTRVGTTNRNRLAHILSDGSVDPNFNPNANNTVWCLLLSGSTLYAGGDFTNIGGQLRNRIAALDISTGNATSWNPNANGSVYALGLSGTTLYAGGSFTSIGGQTRNRIAALDTSTGNATTWNPNANNTVLAIAISGSNVYIGGVFTTLQGGAVTRNYIAALEYFNRKCYKLESKC
jgi:hypothetical protein